MKTKCEACAGAGYFEGARETIVPRAGRVFMQADYPQLELYTLAQCCVSWCGAGPRLSSFEERCNRLLSEIQKVSSASKVKHHDELSRLSNEFARLYEASKRPPICLSAERIIGALQPAAECLDRLCTLLDIKDIPPDATTKSRSSLAEALNAGLDPHMAVAAQILGISYEEAAANKKRVDVSNARQTAKVANFGFPGGLGVKSLILFAKKTYGVVLTQDSAKRLKDQWLEAWPEMEYYFARINALCANDSLGRATVETLYTKRTRGNASYCAACNNGFQALGADCTKRAAWLIAKAQYVDTKSPLYNARTVAIVHDEFIGEVDDGPIAHDAAYEQARLMVVGANEYLKDVPIPMSKMEPLLMRRWSKKAEPRFDANKRLVPWE